MKGLLIGTILLPSLLFGTLSNAQNQISFTNLKSVPQDMDLSKITHMWNLAKEHAGLDPKSPPPPIFYVPRAFWDGGSAVLAEYDNGKVFLYRTHWDIHGNSYPDRVYAFLGEEFFHYALEKRGVPLYIHHCTMIIEGFWSHRVGGSFLKLLQDAGKQGIIQKETKIWMEQRLNDACLRELRKKPNI